MARVWIRGGGSPRLVVSRPGYDALTYPSIAVAGVSFTLDWPAAGTLYLAGSVAGSSLSTDTIVTFSSFGYVPTTRVFLSQGGYVYNYLLVDVVTYPDRIVVAGAAGSSSTFHFFVFTNRVI